MSLYDRDDPNAARYLAQHRARWTLARESEFKQRVAEYRRELAEAKRRIAECRA